MAWVANKFRPEAVPRISSVAPEMARATRKEPEKEPLPEMVSVRPEMVPTTSSVALGPVVPMPTRLFVAFT